MEEDEEEIEGVNGWSVEDQGGERVRHCHEGRTKRLRPIQLKQREREIRKLKNRSVKMKIGVDFGLALLFTE